MDDFAGDLDYLNDIRDAQMFQRTPWRKFERYYKNKHILDRRGSYIYQLHSLTRRYV